MGQAQSSEVRDYRVMLSSDTPHEVHTEIMENLIKAKGGIVSFIYWPKPLGFTCSLPEHHLPAIRARPEVVSINFDDGESIEIEEDEEDNSMWGWVCGTSRRPPPLDATLQPISHRMPLSTHTEHYLGPDGTGMPGSAPGLGVAASAVPNGSSGGGSSSYYAAQEEWMPRVDDAMPDDAFERERQGVKSVLMQLSPLKTDADTATRFLRAKLGDPAAAAGMFRKHLEWRAAERVDELWKEPPLPPLREAAVNRVFAPRLLDGRDKLGRPVLFVAPTDLNLEALAAQGISEGLLLRRYVRAMERVLNALDHSAHPLGGHLALYDVRHLSTVATFRTMNLWIRIGRTLEANYPETLGTLVVVGMPAGSDWVFDHVKSLMNAKTAAKIRLHSGTTARDVRAALTHYLPPESLFRAANEIDLSGHNEPPPPPVDEGDGVTAADVVESGRQMLPGGA